MPITPQRSRAIFQKLERDLIKLSAKPRAENVHGFRTATRRLQVLLGDLSPKLARSHKKLLKMLGRIRKRAGKVRDLDVQLSALRSLKVSKEARSKTELVKGLIESRGKQEKKLRKIVDGASVREIRKRLKRAGKEFNPEKSLDPLLVARGILEPLQLEDAPLTEALLHRYRLLTKRARYAAEFADESAESSQFIADVKKIQDAVGNWHDWFTLAQTARQNKTVLATELNKVTGTKFRHAVALLSQLRAKAAAERAHPLQVSHRAKAPDATAGTTASPSPHSTSAARHSAPAA